MKIWSGVSGEPKDINNQGSQAHAYRPYFHIANRWCRL